MMTERILKSLEQCGISTWKLEDESIRSSELFFIKQDLDMNRAKEVRNYHLTVYRDFEKENVKFRGSAQISLPSSLNDNEMASKIKKAYYAASYVKNPYYPLPAPSNLPAGAGLKKRTLSQEDITPLMGQMIESLYKNDCHKEGGINSAELFINRKKYRFMNSSGIDISYSQNEGIIELICEWNGKSESIELYNFFSFSDMNGSMIEEECRVQIENCRLRAEAVPASPLEGINIILTGEAVQEIMNFYLFHSSAKGIYEKTARGVQGDVFQGSRVKGDLLSISLEPDLPDSPYSAPIDPDGIMLNKTELFKNGKLLCVHGSQRYSFYLGTNATGTFRNVTVDSGRTSLEQWRQKPYLEIRSFSDFQMDHLTGDFGGEIRLALHFDGERCVPVTGATLSASLFDIHQELYLSRERQLRAGFDGPAALMYPEGTVGGS